MGITRREFGMLAASAAWGQSSAPAPEPAPVWIPMFDGATLAGWKETPFSSHGKVTIADSAIVLGNGLMTGITWTKEFPKYDYEVRLEAARVAGHDFFAGITFPVHDTHCTWINGGWGGTVVGLSSLDDMDASENDTRQAVVFETGRWYKLLLRVTWDRIDAWIDGEPIINVYIGDRKVGLRFGDIDLSRPFGIASYSTTSKLRKIEYRRLSAS